MLVETACRLCGASDAVVLLREGDDLRQMAHYGPIPLGLFNRRPISREWPPGRAVVDRSPVHVHDLAVARDEFPVAVKLSADAGRATSQAFAWRTALAMPLLREGEALGVIVLRRVEVWPFSDVRSRCSTPSRTRRSSPSRTRACSTRCRRARATSPRRCSSRRRCPRSCRSYPDRPSIWGRFSAPWWRTRCVSAAHGPA